MDKTHGNLLSDLNLANLLLLEEMYAKFRDNPQSVDASWQQLFTSIEFQTAQEEPLFHLPGIKIDGSIPSVHSAHSASSDLRIYNLIEAYRTYGHLLAQVNPIATHPPETPWQLSLSRLGFAQHELLLPFPTYGILPTTTATLQEIINSLKSIYSNKIGVEYMGLQSPEMELWLQSHIEPNHFKIDLTIDQKKMILHQLNKSELFESFLHTKYTGQKRFSLEGGETLIPILQAIIDEGADLGLEEAVIGMAHRGRLNVLSNILNKSYSDIFSEFEEGYIPDSFEGSGDVKYHKGFSSVVTAADGRKVKVLLTPNPSHLEAVDPVVEGQVRGAQVLKNDDVMHKKVIPILIHGDAALAGQGVIYETLQLYQLPGYSTGGTIHVVINNQIGFTALPEETRSTRYCTDLAKAFGAPVFHVNAEDPEGCVYATILALKLRHFFFCDVFIDLNCYRKYGHNEGDEPAFTQPLEYQIIRQKKSIREVYRDTLIHEGVLEKKIAESLELEFKTSLQNALKDIKIPQKNGEHKISENSLSPPKEAPFKDFKTAVDKKTLQTITELFCTVPKGFTIHPKLQNLIQDRLAMVQESETKNSTAKPIDWGMAELLAYGSLLWEGSNIRISGQDSCRGTFSHRHAIWVDQFAAQRYSPLNNLKENQGRFEIYNSPLSEYAVLGFEFGYSFACPESLVIWEAQFGDFGNGAQIIIDQFISSSEQKWGQKVGLVLLLPHGYEGQGPEHSSARMERFLTLCGDNNMRVVNPTTPAQLFHLLRRQVLNPQKKPLIVFTPKGLLRHPQCISSLNDLTKGSFQEIIDDPSLGDKKSTENIQKLVFCSGRIYYDLIAEREKSKTNDMHDMAIIRIEQLYPLHTEKLKEVINRYKKVKSSAWVQEEPKNMGAAGFILPLLQELMPEIKVGCVGRIRSASPAAGSYALHKQQHAMLIRDLEQI